MIRSVLQRLLLVLLCSTLLSLEAQEWLEVQKVLPPNDASSPIGGQSDRLGWSVAVDGAVLVAGAPESDVNGSGSGAAFVYEKIGGEWTYITQLEASDGESEDDFGWSLDVSGNRIAIGAPGATIGSFNASGAIYIFDRLGGAWTETAILYSDTPSSSDRFGYSVSLDGDRVLVGCFEDDDLGNGSGSALIFERTAGTWNQIAKVLASDGSSGDNFGISVALEDTVAVCGAYLQEAGGTGRGAVYVYHRNNGLWTEVQKLIASDGDNGDRFGISVSTSNGRIAAGAIQDDDGGTNAGAAYLFELAGGTWNFDSKIVVSDASANDLFGHSVSLSGNDLAIGSYQDDPMGTSSGSVYLYTNAGSWSLQQKITAADGAAQDFFGYAVSISGDDIVTGARGDDESGNDSGSLYAYDRTGAVWSFSLKGVANDMIDDPSLDQFGSAVAISGDYALVGSYLDDDLGIASGSIRFYRFQGMEWIDEGKFYSSDIAQEDFFGFRVAISGTTALVSAYGDDDVGSFSGSVYVFERIGGQWIEVQKLLASDGAAFDNFGFSLAIDGDKAVIGAHLDDDFGGFSGAVYLFEKAGGIWMETQKLLPNNGAANDQFGFSVDIQGSQIVIGARNESSTSQFGGAAYIFEDVGGSWSQTAILKPNDQSVNKFFGSAVSVSQGTVLVGAFGDNAIELSSGAAYVFEKVAGIWTQRVKVKSNSPVANEYFGSALDNQGKLLAIGAYRSRNLNNVASGAVFVIDGASGSWIQTNKLEDADGQLSDYYGIDLRLSDSRLLIGAQFDDDNGLNSGSAFFFAQCEDEDNSGECDFTQLSFSNDECAYAVDLIPSEWGIPTWYDQTIFGATESLLGCSGSADDDVWFSFIAKSPDDVVIATDPLGIFNPVIEIFEECGGLSMGCFDNYGPGAIERASAPFVTGEQYFFRVYSSDAVNDPDRAIRVQVKTFDEAKLTTQYCGIANVELWQSVYSERGSDPELYENPVVSVSGYRFRFQEQGGGLDVVVTRAVSNGFYLQLTNVPGLEYGKTYEVSVSHRVSLNVNGTVIPTWSPFGPPCEVQMAEEVPLTNVRPQYCDGSVDFLLEDQLLATVVAGYDRYRFRFEGIGGPGDGQVLIKESSNYAVFLHTVGSGGSGLLYGSTYAVTVQASVQGIWSESGSTCFINMATQPESTMIRPEYCNGAYLFPNSNFLLAETVLGAVQYEWMFSPLAGGISLTFNTNALSFVFGQANQGLALGVTYEVFVRAFAGGTWGDFSASCPITIQGNPVQPDDDSGMAQKSIKVFGPELIIYPNPIEGGSLNLSITEQLKGDILDIEAFDLQGRRVYFESYPVESTFIEQRIHLGSQWPDGIYLLKVSLGQKVFFKEVAKF